MPAALILSNQNCKLCLMVTRIANYYIDYVKVTVLKYDEFIGPSRFALRSSILRSTTMFSWEKNGDRVAIVQMNAELRHAQLEILSAQCATDRLRLRFSAEDIARHAQRDVLRKALLSTSALHRYYSGIASQVTDPDSVDSAGNSSWQ